MHPYLQQKGLVDFHRKVGIQLTAYAPIGSFESAELRKGEFQSMKVLEDPVIVEIAKANDKSPA